MKVYNLCCPSGHGFEGWFGSDADYQSQQERGLLECPVCGQGGIERRPSAPRLNLSGNRAEAPVPAAAVQASAVQPRPSAEADAVAALEAGYLQFVRQVMAQTEDVGPRFTEEVRRIHYGETEHRNLRGQTTREQREALRDEGIEVYALPVPANLKGPLQ